MMGIMASFFGLRQTAELTNRSVMASLLLADPTAGDSHLPHALVPLLKHGHRTAVIAGLVMVVLLGCYAVFKLTQMRPSRHRS